jgi:ferritin-like metal-binding protein YciE
MGHEAQHELRRGLLEQTLAEEKKTGEALTKLAEAEVTAEAA